jgi:hypothetical protein
MAQAQSPDPQAKAAGRPSLHLMVQRMARAELARTSLPARRAAKTSKVQL